MLKYKKMKVVELHQWNLWSNCPSLLKAGWRLFSNKRCSTTEKVGNTVLVCKHGPVSFSRTLNCPPKEKFDLWTIRLLQDSIFGINFPLNFLSAAQWFVTLHEPLAPRTSFSDNEWMYVAISAVCSFAKSRMPKILSFRKRMHYTPLPLSSISLHSTFLINESW